MDGMSMDRFISFYAGVMLPPAVVWIQKKCAGRMSIGTRREAYRRQAIAAPSKTNAD